MASKNDPALKTKPKKTRTLQSSIHPSFPEILGSNFFFFWPGQGVFAKGCCICPQNSTTPRAEGTIPPLQRSQTGESMLASSRQGSGTDPTKCNQDQRPPGALVSATAFILASSVFSSTFPPLHLTLWAERPVWCILSKSLVLNPVAPEALSICERG